MLEEELSKQSRFAEEAEQVKGQLLKGATGNESADTQELEEARTELNSLRQQYADLEAKFLDTKVSQ